MNITMLVLLYPKTLSDGEITIYDIENYVTNSVKKINNYKNNIHNN